MTISRPFLPALTPGPRPGEAPKKPEGSILTSRSKLGLAVVVCLLLMQTVVSALLPHSFVLTVIVDSIDLVLIFSAFLVYSVNRVISTERNRLFWLLLAAGWGTRIIVQVMWMYFEVVLRKEAPNPFIGDILLFLSNIPVLAALLLQPHLELRERRKSVSTVYFLLLLLWWLYLYLFFVIPWQYIVLNEAKYGLSYNRLAGLLDIVEVVMLGVLWNRGLGRWRWFYGAFFGAQVLKAGSSYLVNRAIDEHVYYPGSWFDWPFSVGLAAFTVVGLIGLTLGRTTAASKKLKPVLQVSRLGMLAVLSLPIMAAWAVLDRHTPSQVTQFRVLVMLGTMLVMAFLVFVRQHQLGTELAAANQVLREASLTDPLTGLRNRRFFDVTVSGDANQVLRSYAGPQKSLAHDLIFYVVDLDNFKEVNDRYGHEIGDKVLVEVARRITTAIRNSDVLLRWGGDEFLIVSPDVRRSEAGFLASRVLASVRTAGTSMASAGIQVRPTCSIGWAAFPWFQHEPDDISFEAVLALADRGVYEAKSAGKDRAVGLSPIDAQEKPFVATAGNEISAYAAQMEWIVEPSQPPVVLSKAVTNLNEQEGFRLGGQLLATKDLLNHAKEFVRCENSQFVPESVCLFCRRTFVAPTLEQLKQLERSHDCPEKHLSKNAVMN